MRRKTTDKVAPEEIISRNVKKIEALSRFKNEILKESPKIRAQSPKAPSNQNPNNLPL